MKRHFLALGFIVLSLVTVRADLTNGLVAYYPLNGDANDTSGNGNDGIATDVRFLNVSNRMAAVFTGATSSMVQVSNSPSLDMTNAVTVSIWFNNFGPVDGPEFILDKAWKQGTYHDWSYRAWSFWYSGGGIAVWEGLTNSASDLTSTGVQMINYNRWHHIVSIANGTDGVWQIYTNGVLAAQSVVTPFTLSAGPYPLDRGSGIPN
jgi:hypothetical protein